MPALSLIELIFVGGFFLLMVIGTALDRRNNEYPKWWVLLIGFAGACIYLWGSISFSAIWTAVTSWTFWQPALVYLAAGLVYSVIEFTLSVRRLARAHADSWQRFISQVTTVFVLTSTGREVPSASWVKGKGNGEFYTRWTHDGESTKEEQPVTRIEVSYRDILLKAQRPDARTEDRMKALELFRTYSNDSRSDDFVQVKLDPDTFQVQPTIERRRLADFISAWTFMWPAYAVSLILGDLLVEGFRLVGDVFSQLGGRFVRIAFNGTFKV